MGLVIKTTGLEDYLDGGDAYIKALIMGEPSAGKTRSGSFWPQPIFADVEGGRMSIADRAIPYLEIGSSAEMDDLLDHLRRECLRDRAHQRYRTLVIDTLDAYQRVLIQERLDAEKKESLTGWADWGYLDAKMNTLIGRLHALPMHVLVNLHIKDAKDGGDDGPLIKSPRLKGDIRDQISADFSLVGHMSTFWVAEEGERVLKRQIQWHPDPRFPVLKDRSGTLPRFTSVTFTDEDFAQLQRAFSTRLEVLRHSEDLEELDSSRAPAAVPPVRGGPVAVREEPPARKAAKRPSRKTTTPKAKAVDVPPAPPAAAPAAEPAAEPAAAEPAGESGASSAPEATETDVPAPGPAKEVADAAGDVPSEQASALVAAELGGEEITSTVEADVEADSDSPAETADEKTSPACGTPGRRRDGSLNDAPVPGCGKPLEEENRDIVNIAFLRTRTYLCNACWAAHKAT